MDTCTLAQKMRTRVFGPRHTQKLLPYAQDRYDTAFKSGKESFYGFQFAIDEKNEDWFEQRQKSFTEGKNRYRTAPNRGGEEKCHLTKKE